MQHYRVFQFTRPQGARRPTDSNRSRLFRFNSRAHRGRDPVWRDLLLSSRCFNSRAHRGRDLFPCLIFFIMSMFQFTRPQGARPPRCVHQGCVWWVSIHAPTGGATSAVRTSRVRLVGFNSRAHRGRDRPLSDGRKPPVCFNSRAHRGRDSHAVSAKHV